MQIYRIIVQKTIIEENNSRTYDVFSQDIQGELDVRALIGSINNLVKVEEVKELKEGVAVIDGNARQ